MKKLLFLFFVTIFMSNCSKVEPTAPITLAAPVVVDGPATFVGGISALMTFLNTNIKYPAEARENNIQGKVVATFSISTTGKIINPKIKESVHPLLDNEVLRVINLQPDWKPAIENGVAIESSFTLPVTFKLEGLKKGETPYVTFFE